MLKFILPYPPSVSHYKVYLEGKEVKFHINSNGYLRVKTRKYSRYLHQIVAEEYLGKCPDGLVVNHKDGDKLNNSPSNLEYITPAENTLHAIKSGFINNIGSNNCRSVLNEELVANIKKSSKSITELAKEYRVSKCTISYIKSGRTWKHVKV